MKIIDHVIHLKTQDPVRMGKFISGLLDCRMDKDDENSILINIDGMKLKFSSLNSSEVESGASIEVGFKSSIEVDQLYQKFQFLKYSLKDESFNLVDIDSAMRYFEFSDCERRVWKFYVS